MQYEAKTPKEYLKQLDSDWRKEKLIEVREILFDVDPQLKEGIEYKMLCYEKGGKNIFHLNAQSAYVSLYVGNIEKVENAKEMLTDFNIGKGCIRIKKSNNLSESRMQEFVQATVKTWELGGETGC